MKYEGLLCISVINHSSCLGGKSRKEVVFEAIEDNCGNRVNQTSNWALGD